MKKIVVASKNPIKITATQAAFETIFPQEQFMVEGISVPSGVRDQPMTDAETYQGAHNRTEAAQQAMPDADFWVGLEGGVELKGDEMESFAWMVVRSNSQVGKGRTGTFFLPPPVTALIMQGKELGEADDIVFGKTNSKQANGAIGLLTHDSITRAEFYQSALLLALIPFKNPDLYGQ